LGLIYLFFLILHFTGQYPFKAWILEPLGGSITALLAGFSLLTRVELPDSKLLSGINLILAGQLTYSFSTIILFGLQGLAIRSNIYFVHDILHILRDLSFLGACYCAYKDPEAVIAKF
jgi:hypothetical protein